MATVYLGNSLIETAERLDGKTYMTFGSASGRFTPHYIAALEHGKYSQSAVAQMGFMMAMKIDRRKRFSWGAGFEALRQWGNDIPYERYEAPTGMWMKHDVAPDKGWMHQLYGELKYRGVFLLVGKKEHGSALLNNRLSSGDLIESGNARPIPEIRSGFIDFQNIPFTQGWIQIQGEIGYGMLKDDEWWRNQYNYYNYHIAQGVYYNYKRCYFRTNPRAPFSLTIGMQAAGQFGGTITSYRKGKVDAAKSFKHKVTPMTLLKMFIPTQDGGETFYTGNHLGTWDINTRWRFAGGDELKAYCSWPWEDGSGIGKLNGWDGLWGLEWKARNSRSAVSGVVVEYMDYTNQSGPTHYAPADYPGNTVGSWASGADDYYNNVRYNSYAYFGHSIGSPAFMAPLYNLDGYPAYVANRMRGYHVGVEGQISENVRYRALHGYREGFGNGYYELKRPISLWATMVEAEWTPESDFLPSVSLKVELDRGTMPENSFGAMINLKW